MHAFHELLYGALLKLIEFEVKLKAFYALTMKIPQDHALILQEMERELETLKAIGWREITKLKMQQRKTSEILNSHSAMQGKESKTLKSVDLH